jgi:hypothetical protein
MGDMKYFYYISETKIDMLESQLSTYRNLWPDIAPKIDISGFAIATEFKSQKTDNLIQRTLKLIKKLNKKNLIIPFDEWSGARLHHKFVQDESDWYCGLISVDQKVMYVLWRFWQDAIILLAGSAAHIIGETIKTQEFNDNQVGTYGTWELIFSLEVQSALEEDGGKPLVESLSTKRLDETLFLDKPKDLPPKLIMNRVATISRDIDPVSLGWLCLNHLIKLPKYRIDTIFRVFNQASFRRSDKLIWDKLMRTFLSNKDIEHEKYSTIYIGSPIYTSFA